MMIGSSFVTELSQFYIQEAADVLTRSFLQLNPIWKVYKLSYEEIFPIMRGKIFPCIGKGWSFVLIYQRKVIGVSLQYDFLDYLQAPSMPTDLLLFKKLGRAGQELESKLNLSSIKKGDAIYGLFGVIDPDYASKGFSLSFWWECFVRGKIGGWKYYYSRISSPISLKMLQKLGAEVLAEAIVQTQIGQEKIWMIRMDLDNPFPPLSMLKMMMTQTKLDRPSPRL